MILRSKFSVLQGQLRARCCSLVEAKWMMQSGCFLFICFHPHCAPLLGSEA